MVDNPTKIYNDYVRANLPNSMSYDTGTDRYDINSHSFFKFKNSNWYFNYISKYGYSALSAYAVNGLEPALVFDFKGNYFRKSATDSTFGASITHAATTNATMVDSDGLLKWRPHNNLPKSNTFSTWGGVSVVVVDNAAVGPNGIANTASTVNFSTGGSHLYNLSTVPVKQGYKVTLAAWVRSDTITSITFAINGRTAVANNTPEANLAVTSTWTLVSFEATVPANDSGLYFAFGKANASSPASQIGELELYGAHMFRSDLGGMVNNPDTTSSYVPTTSAAVYAPRRGHHIYNGSAWVNEGILHESEARTNVATYSNDFGNVAYLKWLPSNITVTPNSAISPDGTTNATKFDMASNGYTRKITGHVPSVGQTYTFSVWIKAGTASEVNTNLLFSGGGLGYTSVTHTLTNEWQRFTVTSTLASGTPDQVRARIVATQAGTIFVYGAQIEEGSTPSSYIPTTTASVTRAAETLTVPAANLPYDNTNMSIQIDGKMTYADTNKASEVAPYYWRANGTNFIYSFLNTQNARTGELQFFQRQSTSGQDLVESAENTYSPDTNVPFNLAGRYGSTFLNGAHEGTLLTANTTPTILPNLSSTNLLLGSTFMGTIGQFRMWSDDLGDVGITEATLPSTEPSLSLTFDGSENSFIVLDWSE